MRAYVAFIKKEGLELVRTYKLLLMILIFFAFGVMIPTRKRKDRWMN